MNRLDLVKITLLKLFLNRCVYFHLRRFNLFLISIIIIKNKINFRF